MVMGRRKESRQAPLFVTAEQLPRSQGQRHAKWEYNMSPSAASDYTITTHSPASWT